MFEKSLYDLIRGLRNHKGNEKEYIQESLRECRKEIRSQDMNLKATALLKITYLEMFGYDMSWASFNVLEVMSSQIYGQKKVGYLAAIQSFRPDTEVLMLAENLLKKDLTSPTPVVITLPLVAIPHVVNPSMANSLLSDLLPRLTHSHAAIRKKTIVTLYRLALVYPETLRPAWPKIKERLQDENEDPSVTSAIVNVVCELGWRRPQDFLPLAPRLFDLLVAGGNNWMAIKLIKLFATLTPLEPRLIKKLLPPLTTIIKTTPAMSLLYECIHGIIQGGILDSIEGTTEGEEVARLCVGKLRSMLVVEGDPNLKFVALLAFQKIVTSHPHLVSLHQDVILECIDDPDISIRMRALDLAVGMVNPENVAMIVERLLRQLFEAPVATAADDITNDRGMHNGVEPAADSDDEGAGEALRPAERKSSLPPPLPEEYRVNAIRSILEICSRDTYANLSDFDWYLDVLVKLVKACPTVQPSSTNDDSLSDDSRDNRDISYAIGRELQNVAVRVKSMRTEAAAAAQFLLLTDSRDKLFPAHGNGGRGVLGYCAWIAGEYAPFLTSPEAVLDSLLHSSTTRLPPPTLAISIHAILKLVTHICGSGMTWTPHRRTTTALLLAKTIHFLEPLASHPALEVQERAVEYLELLRLAAEAATGHPASDEAFAEPPLLLTQALPALFTGMELNPVAPGALRKVPPPADIDLDAPINPNLAAILRAAEEDDLSEELQDGFEIFYKQRPEGIAISDSAVSAAARLEAALKSDLSSSYQNPSPVEDDATTARRRAERRERYKDDPFYIASDEDSGSGSQMHRIIKNSNGGEEIDIDAIPIMDLELEHGELLRAAAPAKKKASRRRVEIVADENLGGDGEDASRPDPVRPVPARGKKSVLLVDSSGLGSLSLEGDSGGTLDIEQREAEEKALREVERLRLEMQRASERIQAKEEGVVVRKKKKKRVVKDVGEGAGGEAEASAPPEGEKTVKKKKKKKGKEGDAPPVAVEEGVAAKPKKKKRQIDMTDAAVPA